MDGLYTNIHMKTLIGIDKIAPYLNYLIYLNFFERHQSRISMTIKQKAKWYHLPELRNIKNPT